ncbi:MAG: T9SS type A sorting domain-containing protein [Bacteroidota bacterium]
MKRNFTLSLLLVFASLTVNAQLPDGSLAPNFTATDIDGNEHTLYDVLDSGKSVIIDFMATWCGPCWNFHETHATSDLYAMYGPTGTDEMVVFMIESDNTTELDCLFGQAGCSSNTYGDWTEGVEYPIFDDHTIAPLFNVGYYPTIYHICPDRVVVEAGQTNAAGLYAPNANCQSPTGDNNVKMHEYSGFRGEFCGSTSFVPSFIFQNMGNAELTSATFELYLNGTMTESIDWTGGLGTYGADEIVFSDVTVTEATDIEIKVSTVNGGADEDDSNNSVTASVNRSPSAESFVVVEIQTDAYGDEVYWEVRNEAGEVVHFGGNPNVGTTNIGTLTFPPNPPITHPDQYGNNVLITDTVNILSLGCHTFHITDYYGDGMSLPGTGPAAFFRVRDNMGNVLYQSANNPSYVEELTDYEGTGVNSTNELTEVAHLNFFPNPASEQVAVAFDLTESLDNVTIEVTNIVGQRALIQQVGNLLAGSQRIDLNIADFQNGIYNVSITSGDRVISQKLVVQH